MDIDARNVMQYAMDHPEEDQEDCDDFLPPRKDRAIAIPPKVLQGPGDGGAMETAELRECKRVTASELPVPVRKRVKDVEAKRGSPTEQEEPAKFVRFEEAKELKNKQQKTELYSLAYAGPTSGSPTSASARYCQRKLRRIAEEDKREAAMMINFLLKLGTGSLLNQSWMRNLWLR